MKLISDPADHGASRTFRDGPRHRDRTSNRHDTMTAFSSADKTNARFAASIGFRVTNTSGMIQILRGLLGFLNQMVSVLNQMVSVLTA